MSKSKLKGLGIGVSALVIIVAIALVLGWKDKRPVRVGYLQIAAHLPLFVALEKDYFEQYDIEVEPIPFTSSTEMYLALNANKLDVGYEMSADLILRIHGEDTSKLRVYQVGVSTSKDPIDAIIVAADSPIDRISDLKGKELGVFPGPTAQAMARLILELDTLKVPNDVNVRTILPYLQLGALANGQVDALFTYEPIPTIALQKKVARMLIRGPVENLLEIDPWVGGFGVFRYDFLKSEQRKALAFRDAIYRAFDDVTTYPKESRMLLRKYVRTLSDADEKVLLSIPLTSHWKLAEVDEVVILRLIDSYQREAVIPKTREIDVSTLFAKTFDFME